MRGATEGMGRASSGVHLVVPSFIYWCHYFPRFLACAKHDAYLFTFIHLLCLSASPLRCVLVYALFGPSTFLSDFTCTIFIRHKMEHWQLPHKIICSHFFSPYDLGSSLNLGRPLGVCVGGKAPGAVRVHVPSCPPDHNRGTLGVAWLTVFLERLR